MTLLFSSPSVVDVEFRQGLLEQQGIACTVRNVYLSGTLSEGRVTFAVPELWAVHDTDVGRALATIAPAMTPMAPGIAWICPQCGEASEAQFMSCWNCGATRTPNKEFETE